MNYLNERTLTIPLEVVENSKGIGLDIGSSAFKLIYLHKDDWQAIQNAKTKPEMATMRLHTFSNTNFDEGIDFINKNCAIMRKGEEKPVICGSGITASQEATKLSEKCNFLCELYGEADCFVNAFCYLARTIPRKEMLVPPCQAAIAESQAAKERMQLFIDSSQTSHSALKFHDVPSSTEAVIDESLPAAKAQNIYPCIFVMAGSGGGIFKVTEDGGFSACDVLHDCGRTFHALASLFTGGKSYSEILKLTEEGNDRNVNYRSTDIEVVGTEDIYGELITADKEKDTDSLIFCFGKAVNKTIGDFAPGDLCKALLQTICLNIVQTSTSAALRFGAKHVFYSGGFLAPRVAKEMCEVMFEQRIAEGQFMLGDKANISCHFLVHGSHYGALGAALNNTLHFLSPPSAAAAAMQQQQATEEPDEQTTHL